MVHLFGTQCERNNKVGYSQQQQQQRHQLERRSYVREFLDGLCDACSPVNERTHRHNISLWRNNETLHTVNTCLGITVYKQSFV